MAEPEPIHLQVNGQTREVVGPSGRTLLRVLREDLSLTGARGSCGIGVCGACTVLIDGLPVSSCLLLAELVEGRDITTIEGLAQEERLHPVQQAFIDEAAFQCAYCTPGFILSTVAMLDESPQPSEDHVREYLAGNLCRCGCYFNIIRAVKAAVDLSARSPTGSAEQHGSDRVREV